MPSELYKTMHEQQECAHAMLNSIQNLFANNHSSTITQALDNKILEGLIQLYAIGTNIEDSKCSTEIDPDDITQIGEYGFNLLTELLQWAHKNHCSDFTKTTRQLILSLALWISKHQGELRTLEPIIDAFAQTANKTNDSIQLKQLVKMMDNVIASCSSVIKNDSEKINPLRPWRVIHLNKAITATRSHDTELIRRVFQDLVYSFPDDAADFFSEGMHEIDRLNYPEPVRQILQEYFNKYSRPKMN
ncbi:MAG: hypothetical protein R8G33_10695 [Gammaproteobacteria bacterium]|nr:hypothetical protein [Gammaproteobacteria bacterium]